MSSPIPTDVTGQRVQGSADLKVSDEVGEQCHASGGGGGGGGGFGIGGYQYRNTVRKVGKYRNTVSKIDEIPVPHLFSVTLT